MASVPSTSVSLATTTPTGNSVDFGTLVIKGVTYKVTVTSTTSSDLQDKEVQAVALQAIKILVENALTSVTGQVEHIDLTENGLTIREKDKTEQHVNYDDTTLNTTQHQSFTSIYQAKFPYTLSKKTTQSVANELFRIILSGTLRPQEPATESPQTLSQHAHAAYSPTSKALAPLSAHPQSRRRTRTLSPSVAAPSAPRDLTRRGRPTPLGTSRQPLILPQTTPRSGFTQPLHPSSAASSAAHLRHSLHPAAYADSSGLESPHSPVAAPSSGEDFRIPHSATGALKPLREDSRRPATQLSRDNPHLEILEEGHLDQAASSADFPPPPQRPGAAKTATPEPAGSRQVSRRVSATAAPILDYALKSQLVQALIAVTR